MPARPMFTVLTLAVLAAGLQGCFNESYVYRSTPSVPQSVSLRDTRTGETVWAADIEVGHQLNVTFLKRPDTAERDGFDQMGWDIVPLGSNPQVRRNIIRTPPPSARRLDVEVRRPGEFPRTPTPTAAPTATSARP